MTIVLDASAAFDILFSKGRSEKYTKEVEQADVVIAPDIYSSEISNVAWKHGEFAGFTHEDILSLAEDGINLIDQYVSAEEIWRESLREAINNNHPVYDCLYVVCARRNDGVLLTRDRKLENICKRLNVSNI